MRSLSEYLQAVIATVKRDARISLSYRLRLVAQILGGLLTLTVFFYVAKLARPDAVGHRASYYPFLVVGILALAMVESGLNLSLLVRLELVAGNFERILISPFGPIGGVLAMAVFPITYATVVSGITLLLAAAIYAVPVNISAVPAALVVAAMGGTAFAALGVLFVAALIAFKSSSGPVWVIAGLGLLGGIYFPVALFPGWIRWASDVQPLTPTVDLLRHLLVGAPSIEARWLELLKLFGFVAVLLPLSGVVLGQAVGLSRRRGTIMEY